MTQNIYDDERFFRGYSRLPRSVKGLDGAPEWPALKALLPPMRGLRVLDLGSGFGWFCRWSRQAGAASVLGLDVSEKMLARARIETSDVAIVYTEADLERVDLGTGAFDLTYSSLVFHYIEDLPGLFARIHRALGPAGRLVFSMEHPIYMAPHKPGWLVDQAGQKTWPVDSYFAEGRRTTNWLADGVAKYHRTLGTTLNHLIRAGFALSHVEEWSPTAAQLAAAPQLDEERERPMFLLVAAERR